jgi:hypothetical protein
VDNDAGEVGDVDFGGDDVTDVVVEVGWEMLSRCFWRASCWEWRRRYFCRANARSGDF